MKKAKKHITVSVGESVRIVRKLQELSQNRLTETHRIMKEIDKVAEF
jgi:hypothetical protein